MQSNFSANRSACLVAADDVAGVIQAEGVAICFRNVLPSR